MWFSVVLLLLPLSVRAVQPGDLLDAFQAFVHSLVAAATLDPAQSVNSAAFTPNVVGRINMMITLAGVENNTEFLYGRQHLVAQSETTQLIGFPVDAKVDALSIQNSIVSGSLILELMYETLGLTLPVQVDLWMRFDEEARIEAYDLSARRWDRSWGFLQPALVETIVDELDMFGSNLNATRVVATRAARDICTVAEEHCQNEYDSFDTCVDELSQVDFAQDFNLCRYVHKDMAVLRPEAHCPSIGRTGGSVCGPVRDITSYVETTTTYPFAGSLVSINVTASGTDGLSDKAKDELTKMNIKLIYPTTVAYYGIPAFLYFTLLYVSGKWTEMAFMRYSKVFPGLTFENRRNTVTYAMNTFYTSVALALQLIASPMLAERYTMDRIDEIRCAAVVVSGLYLYELIYRPNMRWPLLVHHFCTLFSIVFLQIALQISRNPALFVAGFIWIFQATTEQSLFVSLLLYRLRYPKVFVQWCLKVAAVQSFVFKMVFAIYLMVWWGLKLAKFHEQIDIAFSVMLVTIASLLMATQIYGSWAVWCIAVNMEKKYDTPSRPHDEEKGMTSPTSSSSSSSMGEETVGVNTPRPDSRQAQKTEGDEIPAVPLIRTESLASTIRSLRNGKLGSGETLSDGGAQENGGEEGDDEWEDAEESADGMPSELEPRARPPLAGGAVAGRDSVLMFGSSEQTRLQTERMSWNRVSLPM